MTPLRTNSVVCLNFAGEIYRIGGIGWFWEPFFEFRPNDSAHFSLQPELINSAVQCLSSHSSPFALALSGK
jgi:hypothetical protein